MQRQQWHKEVQQQHQQQRQGPQRRATQKGMRQLGRLGECPLIEACRAALLSMKNITWRPGMALARKSPATNTGIRSACPITWYDEPDLQEAAT